MAESNDLAERIIDKVLRPLADKLKDSLVASDEVIRTIAIQLSEWLQDEDRDESITIQRKLLVSASATADSLRVFLCDPKFQDDDPIPDMFDNKRTSISILHVDKRFYWIQTSLGQILRKG